MAYIIPRIDPKLIEWDEIPENVLTLDISKSVAEYLKSHPDATITPAHVMAFTQRSWIIDPREAASCDLIFACCKTPLKHRQIIGVFVYGRDGVDKFVEMVPDCDQSRRVFLAEPAPEPIWNKYAGLLLPARQQGEANPVRYCKQDGTAPDRRFLNKKD